MSVAKTKWLGSIRQYVSCAIIGAIILFCSPANSDEKANLPQCQEQRVINAAVTAMEDVYHRTGIVVTGMLNIVKTSLKPSWLPDTAKIERASGRALGYGAEHVRLCLAAIDKDTRIAVYIFSDPQNLNKWVVAVSNFGAGNAVAESLSIAK